VNPYYTDSCVTQPEPKMSNLTIAVDDDIIKRARIRAIGEGTSVSAKIRGFLSDYAEEGLASLHVAEPAAQARYAASAGKGPRAELPEPAEGHWVTQLRAQVERFGGIEPEEWLPVRDRSPDRVHTDAET
jgi:plasmid stability protein